MQHLGIEFETYTYRDYLGQMRYGYRVPSLGISGKGQRDRDEAVRQARQVIDEKRKETK